MAKRRTGVKADAVDNDVVSSRITELILVLARAGEDAVSGIKTLGPVDGLTAIAAATIIRAFNTFKAINCLGESGYGPDAWALSRSLVDYAVNLAYIADDPSSRVDRFLEYWRVEGYRVFDKAGRPGAGRQATVLSAGEWADMKRLYDEASETYKPPSRWSDKTIDQMAEEVGQKHPAVRIIYNLWFRPASSFVHGAVTGLFAYMELHPGGTYTVRDALPRSYEKNPVLQACMGFMVVLDEACTCLGMEPPDDLARAQRLVDNLVTLTEKEPDA